MWAWLPLLEVLVGAWLLAPTAQAGAVEGVVTDVEVTANVEHRYAVTRVATKMFNPRTEPAQLLLQMSLPKAALISSFVMEMGGANFSGTVHDRTTARRTYEAARQQGRTAGLLELRDNELQKFQVRARVEGLARATFYVAYEELLRRVDGSFTYTTHLNPGQRVSRASVEVRVLERETITDYKVTRLPGQEIKTRNPGTKVTGGTLSQGELHVRYQHEDPEEGEGRGVDGTFTLTYDISNHTDGGEVQRVGSYFAHFFSPERLPVMPTHTVFLLDVSLSMYNGKLDNMKKAMKSILREMRPEDTFDILAFSSDVVSVGSFAGEGRQVKKAVRKVRRLVSLGYSNLNAALLQALTTADRHANRQAIKQVVVYSDGQVTAGETDPATIRKNVHEANEERHPIFVFVSSDDESRLLEDVSADSGGFVQYMQHGSTLAEQIKSFYKEIAKPLVADVDIKYPGNEVDPRNLARSGMPTYYSGGEIVVAGRLRPGVIQAHPAVSGHSSEGPYQLPVIRLDSRDPYFSSIEDNYIARIWAYLMVQNLMDQAEAPHNVNNTKQLHDKAQEIAMRFNFVSPLTSLVVVYPHNNSLIVSLPEGRHHSGAGSQLQNFAAAYSGYRRSGRSNMRGLIPQTYVDLDPHFILHSQELDLPLCFNFQGSAGAIVRLIHDPQSGILVNGQVTAAAQRPNKYFTSLFLQLGQVNITVTPELLQVDCLGEDGIPQVGTVVKSLWPFYKKNGRKYKRRADRRNHANRATRQRANHGSSSPGTPHNYLTYKTVNSKRSKTPGHPPVAPLRLVDDSALDCLFNTTWEKGVGRIYGNVMVVLSKKKNLEVTIGDGLAHFIIARSKNRRGQRFLGFYTKDQEIFSPHTHGMMGQFISKRIRQVSYSAAAGARMEDGTGLRIKMQVERRNKKKKVNLVPLSGVVERRHSLMGQTQVKCIHVRGRGRGLLDGQLQDYLLPCLQC